MQEWYIVCGEVYAKVWYTETEKVYFKQQMETKTGEVENKYRLSFNNFTINLYKNLSKFENYDTNEEKENLKIVKNFYLPISMTKIRNEEKVISQKIYTIDEAKQIAENDLKRKIEEKIENKENIINLVSNSKEEADCVEVKVTYEVIENIGESKKKE